MGMRDALSALCTRKLTDPYKRKRNCWSMKKKVFIGLYWSLPYYIQNENSSFKIYNVLNCLLIQEILIGIEACWVIASNQCTTLTGVVWIVCTAGPRDVLAPVERACGARWPWGWRIGGAPEAACSDECFSIRTELTGPWVPTRPVIAEEWIGNLTQGSYKIRQPFFKNFLRTTLDFRWTTY